jgi:hypothetical protein
MSFLNSVFSDDEELDNLTDIEEEEEEDEDWDDMHERVAAERHKLKQIKRLKTGGDR